ncbi:MAG: DUF1015 family protein [Chromatiales bacterium]|nr:DUF1015 family protein [Chromatiales bacterium]
MSLIKPFRGLRPTKETAAAVAAPPYDVMNAEEARAMVRDKPWSFLHISRPEVDLPQDCDPYAPEVYAKAKENLDAMLAARMLIQDEQPSYYVYRLTQGGHVQVGLVCAASVTAYDQGRIKKHELTRPAKEDDRVRQIEALSAQTGPVFMVYPADSVIDNLLLEVTQLEGAELDVTADDGVRHEVWPLADSAKVEQLTQLFEQMPALYVADGHHRSAAASRVAGNHGSEGQLVESSRNYFLSVIFPHTQVQILPYNRLIRDLNGLDREGFIAQIKARFSVTESDLPVQPDRPAQCGLYLAGQWYRLELDAGRIPDDPVASLEVSLLGSQLIEPILGIVDQRRDQRIEFVGGIRGLAELERRVDSGEMALALSLYPTSMDALMAVADAGEIMPPKSTWFEPKLADGLVSHLLE